MKQHSSNSVRQLPMWGASLLSAFLFLACGPGGQSTLTGRTSDSVGSQQQALSSDLGGSGTVQGSAKIRASRIKADGSLELITETQLSSDGTYALSVPAGENRLILEAVNSSGATVASAIAVSTGTEGQTIAVAPLSSETSVEAQVLLQMIANGSSAEDADAVDLRARINAKTAEAVAAASDSHAAIRALAEAVIAAQRAQLQAWAKAGVQTSHAALFSATVHAALTLDASLDQAKDDEAAAARAYDAFLAELTAQWQTASANARNAARGESAASAAFRATVRARLQANASPVVDAAARCASALEARASTVALEAILDAGQAGDAVLASTKSANAQLRASLSSSTSAAASAQAWAAWRASLVGDASVSGSVLGNYLAVNATTQASAQAAVEASASAAAQLDTAINQAADASLSVTDHVDFTAYAGKIADAYAAHDSAIRAQSATLVGFGSKANVAVDVLLIAEGSLRAQ